MQVAELNSESRNRNLKTQIYLSIILRGTSIILSFYVVRMTLGYLGKDFYGIWIVLLSIVSWISLFDIGIANGLRNKLTIALANNDILDARKNISTAYVAVTFVGVLVFIGSAVCTFLLDWASIFNSKLLSQENYRTLLLIFFFAIAISFVLSLINAVLNSFQKTAYTNWTNILTNGIFIALLLIWKNYFNGSIIKMMGAYGMATITGNLAVSILFFAKHIDVIPRLEYFSKDKIREILSLGGNFFVIQIAVLLIFTVDNFLILQLLGTTLVATYNVVFKLFSVFTIGFGIIITPLWSAFTEAKEKNDYAWMKNTIRKLNQFLAIVVLGLVAMYFLYQPILNLWLPKNQPIIPSKNLILSFCVFIIISVWNNIYAFFLNGIGIVKMQVRTAIAGAIINIPLAIFLVKVLHFGLSGIVLSMCGSLFIFSIFGPITTYKYLKQNG